VIVKKKTTIARRLRRDMTEVESGFGEGYARWASEIASAASTRSADMLWISPVRGRSWSLSSMAGNTLFVPAQTRRAAGKSPGEAIA